MKGKFTIIILLVFLIIFSSFINERVYSSEHHVFTLSPTSLRANEIVGGYEFAFSNNFAIKLTGVYQYNVLDELSSSSFVSYGGIAEIRLYPFNQAPNDLYFAPRIGISHQKKPSDVRMNLIYFAGSGGYQLIHQKGITVDIFAGMGASYLKSDDPTDLPHPVFDYAPLVGVSTGYAF